jgi:phage terminase small subunit
MPVLKNARHERFAHALAKGKTATDAYEEAGYKPDRHHAARLATKGHITSRVDEIKNRVAEKAEWSAADRLMALKTIFDASAADDRRTAIAAIAEANKMQGSYAPTKQEHTGRNGGPIEYANMTEEEIDARIAAIVSGVGEDEPSGEA